MTCNVYSHINQVTPKSPSQQIQNLDVPIQKIELNNLPESLAVSLPSSPVLKTQASESFTIEIWSQKGFEMYPPGLRQLRICIWSFFSLFGIFSNKYFSILLIKQGKKIIHYSCLLPKYFRYPFMGSDDLQISGIWTSPDYRNQGLAKFAINFIAHSELYSGRKLWYIVNKINTPSVKVVEANNFEKIGSANRYKRFGIKILGYFGIS